MEVPVHQSTIPPRSHVVRMNTPDFTGEMIRVGDIPETATPLRILQLISGDQLVASSCGLFIGHVIRTYPGERVYHSTFGPVGPAFLGPFGPGASGTRILRVGSEDLLVWGRAEGHPSGVWRLTHDASQFLHRLDRLEFAEGPRPNRVPVGTSAQHPGQKLYLTSWGLWPVDARATVRVCEEETLCVLESFGGLLYAYQATEHGATPFLQINPGDAQRPAGLVRWQGRLMLAVNRGTQSWLVELNRRAFGEEPERISIDGELHGVWSSPKGGTLLMLTHPRGATSDARRLTLSTGEVIHEGTFTLEPSKVAWSPDELSVVAGIVQDPARRRFATSRFVGSNVDWTPTAGTEVREVLLGNDGRIQAHIQHEGIYDVPHFRGHRGTAVPLAWNLHMDSDGGVVWTTVHDQQILTWVSRTVNTHGIHPILR